MKIEAGSLTIGQIRDVINGKTVSGASSEIQEVKNAYSAYEKLLQNVISKEAPIPLFFLYWNRLIK